MPTPRGVELDDLRTAASVSSCSYGEAVLTYRCVVALGNQPFVALAINLKHGRVLGVEGGLYSRKCRQDTNCNGAESGVMHGGLVALCTRVAVEYRSCWSMVGQESSKWERKDKTRVLWGRQTSSSRFGRRMLARQIYLFGQRLNGFAVVGGTQSWQLSIFGKRTHCSCVKLEIQKPPSPLAHICMRPSRIVALAPFPSLWGRAQPLRLAVAVTNASELAKHC